MVQGLARERRTLSAALNFPRDRLRQLPFRRIMSHYKFLFTAAFRFSKCCTFRVYSDF